MAAKTAASGLKLLKVASNSSKWPQLAAEAPAAGLEQLKVVQTAASGLKQLKSNLKQLQMASNS